MSETQRNTFFSRPDIVMTNRTSGQERAELYVVTTIFNPIRFRTRWKLFQDFARMVRAAGARLYVAEIAFGERQFALNYENTPEADYILQLVSDGELWIKETALNLLIQHLPIDWQYVATVDADVSFARGDWADETLHVLQNHPVAQMWSEAQDLSPDYETICSHHSFVYSYMTHEETPPDAGYYYAPKKAGKPGVHFYHPGFAWAYRRSALRDLGGLIDWGVAGAGDNHMAKALIGDAAHSVHPEVSGAYRDMVLQWQDRAAKYIKNDLGLVRGKLTHYWHGKKALRQYWTRWKILTETQFNPITDLKKDEQGLIRLVVESQRQQKLRDLLRGYFRQRNEDGIDL